MDTIPKNYDHAIEDKWSEYWIKNKTFTNNEEHQPSEDDFILIIPPPNVTGNLHIGHALNNTYQDLLLRMNKMKGKTSIWIPGTDHAGIATQTKVEKYLMTQNESFDKEDMGQEDFIKEIYKWKNDHGDTIIRQLQRLGCGCDWDRTQFTMNPEFSKLVREVFVKLYKDDLIYQSEYIVNWCPVSKTALANEEVIYEDQKTELYYLRYYLCDEDGSKSDNSLFLLVATTRPETILGDVAIAFNPNDIRYKHLEGKYVLVPLVNRPVPIIKDKYPRTDFGTGLVKITPAHDLNDFKVGQRHKLPNIKILDEEAKIANTKTKYDNLDRFKAREEILKDLKKAKLFDGSEPYTNRIGKSYRSGAIVESILSKQWFVKMRPLMDMVLEHEDSLNFFPHFQKDKFMNWANNIQDWCISRQIWWGHQIPIWYGSDGSVYCDTLPPLPNDGQITYKQETDVLDTWFSAWLWPIGVFPESESIYRNNINVLVTGSDILFFWVIRMLMASVYLTGKLPFKHIYLHGLIRDKDNQKMSKSKGNVIDPLTVINEYSADAIRFSLVMKTPHGQDVPFSHKDVEVGKNFATKLWNTVRYIMDIDKNSRSTYNNLLNSSSASPIDYVHYLHREMNIKHNNTDVYAYIEMENILDGFDIWIMGELYKTVQNVETYYEEYKFSASATEIYTFVWDKFCSIYLETTKFQKDEINKHFVLNYILNNIIQLIHPIMPFVTEEINYMLSFNTESQYTCISELKSFPVTNESGKQIIILDLPYPNHNNSDINNNRMKNLYKIEGIEDENVSKYMNLVKSIRSIKSTFGIPVTIQNEITGEKEEFRHGNITLNKLDSDLLCFITQNKTYLINSTKINNIGVKINEDDTCYEVKTNDMIILYPIDKYFKFDNKIGVLKNKKENINCKIKQNKNKLDKTSSENKKKKINKELSNLLKEISQLQSELDYYSKLGVT